MVIAITSIKEQYRNLADEQSSSADLLLTSYFEKIIGESTLDLSNLSENVQDTIKFYSTDCYYKPATGILIKLLELLIIKESQLKI